MPKGTWRTRRAAMLRVGERCEMSNEVRGSTHLCTTARRRMKNAHLLGRSRRPIPCIHVSVAKSERAGRYRAICISGAMFENAPKSQRCRTGSASASGCEHSNPPRQAPLRPCPSRATAAPLPLVQAALHQWWATACLPLEPCLSVVAPVRGGDGW